MTKKKATIILLAIVLLVPFPTQVVPEWTLVVVDQDNAPYQDLLVRQYCYSYTLDVDACTVNYDLRTNKSGVVTFPRRVIILPLILRIVFSARSLLRLIPHGSLGTTVYWSATGPQGFKTLDYSDDLDSPTRFILPSK